ncbi:protein ERGIC-53-like isoform X2 [Patiria miniata]|uniref:L-type lectin-like domain-containing protein n=1 Tax=Patiria miniata TaxID=46514 RepID=A0A914A3R4_PATMI|nr:protein ERGIC-53-like isoform X2 [Patiria miniata]
MHILGKMATCIVRLLLLLLSAFSICFAQQPHRRFEYKHSFKGPHLMQKDGTVPFWQYGGSAFASDEQVRITPSIRSQKGYIWSKYKVPHDHWEVEFYFKVTGRGRVGADGLAFWYVDNKPAGVESTPGQEPPPQHPTQLSVFGGPDKWNGLAVIFDSFDNDNMRNNPYILSMVNDGTVQYQHNTDGMNQQLGGCLRDYRNKPYPVRAKIEYYKKTLTLFIHNGWTNIDSNYELCMRREDVTLPKDGYFGITAATGGLADDHDVIKFLTHSLTPPDEPRTPEREQAISDDEEERFKKEYDEYYEKLQQQKKEYQEKHPDKVKDEALEETFFEDTETRELRQIYEVQSLISKTIGDLNRKLDEIVGRQERTLSAISAVQASVRGGGAPPASTGGQPVQPVTTSEIKRHEVDTILNTQHELQRSIRDVRSVIGEVQAKASSIHNKVDSVSQGNQGNQDFMLNHELRDKLSALTGDVSQLLRKSDQASSVQCPPQEEFPNCLTPVYFIFLLVLQGGFFFLYAVYRSKQEAAAKKFY